MEPKVKRSSKAKDRLRVLVVSHGHPALSRGGAEIAAHELFTRLGEQHDAWYLGCNRASVHHKAGASISQPFSEREYLYSPGEFDWFKFANHDPKFPEAFRELLSELRPDVVHFHHYLDFGVEAFLHVRETLPDCRIVVTLHEYLAICHHYGQMVTRSSHALCHEATPVRCGRCFSDISATDFFLRKQYIQRFFALVDRFIAPSEFLSRRYVEWGIAESRIAVLENVIRTPAQPVAQPAAPKRLEAMPLRIGFFGQVSMLKGINVVFEAAAMLAEAKNFNIVFDIHGDHSGQPPEFQKDFLERLAKAGRNVKFHGPYEPQRVDGLMRSVDLVLVPSIWWENSPVVIQEALRNRRPIVCSDIGGMAEKVRDGVDGFTFSAGNAVSLVAQLTRLHKAPEKLQEMEQSMRCAADAGVCTEEHVALYRDVA